MGQLLVKCGGVRCLFRSYFGHFPCALGSRNNLQLLNVVHERPESKVQQVCQNLCPETRRVVAGVCSSGMDHLESELKSRLPAPECVLRSEHGALAADLRWRRREVWLPVNVPVCQNVQICRRDIDCRYLEVLQLLPQSCVLILQIFYRLLFCCKTLEKSQTSVSELLEAVSAIVQDLQNVIEVSNTLLLQLLDEALHSTLVQLRVLKQSAELSQKRVLRHAGGWLCDFE